MESKFNEIMSTVSKYVNISAAKKIAFPLVILLISFQSIHYFDKADGNCERLLYGGTLVDKTSWQPSGCMLHNYNINQSKKCFQNTIVAFIGDSRMREIFYTFTDLLSDSTFGRKEDYHSNVIYGSDNVQLEFLWYPEPNSSMVDLYKGWIKNPENSPDVVVHSIATHTIKRTQGLNKGLDEYRQNLTSYILPLMKKYNTVSNSSLYWMMQEPVVEDLLKPERRFITNIEISNYNEAAGEIFEAENDMTVIASNVDVANQLIQTSADGLHLGTITLNIDTQILLNLFCNEIIQPTDGTCCKKPSPLNFLQILSFALGVLFVIGAIIISCFCKVEKTSLNPENGGIKSKNSENDSSARLLIISAAKMSLILLYFYICDRTDIFMKSNKHYTHVRFFIPLIYVTLLGVFGIDQVKQTNFLNRDQTDEWKGWMQLIILIYHITGASVNVPIYMHIRLLVSMYLFMTGYGHFSYFWNKGDFSLSRVFSVMFRLNFLTVLLCAVMDRSYQFYYFVPLCSFWFLVLYVSMAMWPRAVGKKTQPQSNIAKSEGVAEIEEVLQNGPTLRSPTFIMGFKLLALFIGIVLVFYSQSVYEYLCSWWPAIKLFELPPGSVREWWFRSQLDRFAMFHGATFCFAYIILKRLSILDDSRQGCLMSTRTSLVTVTASIFIIVAYTIWTMDCTSKQDCNAVHSYASILPITAFILVRNIPGYLRTGYSAFFAWFGQISLELFIGQYHIWLAADTKGILVLTSSDWPTLNLVVTTFIFVCVAHEINILTGIFAKYAVGAQRDNKSTSMRVLLLVAVIVLLVVVNDLTKVDLS